MSVTVTEITEAWLAANGYDGLYSPHGECACLIGDLMPCCEPHPGCIAGWKRDGCDGECGMGCDWHVSDERRAAAKEAT